MLGYLANVGLHPSNTTGIYKSKHTDRPCEVLGASWRSIAATLRASPACDACEWG